MLLTYRQSTPPDVFFRLSDIATRCASYAGNNGKGHSHQSNSRPAAASPAQGANTEPLGDRIVNHVGWTSLYNAAEKCPFCKIAGHSTIAGS